jgi:hypothetical protein
MPDTPQNQDLLRRALVNLNAVRTNLPEKLVNQPTLYQQFDTALDQLEQAGEDANEWRISRDERPLHSLAFKAKIDAILAYFTIRKENTQIGFHK